MSLLIFWNMEKSFSSIQKSTGLGAHLIISFVSFSRQSQLAILIY